MEKRQLKKTWSLLDRTYEAIELLQKDGFDKKFDLSTIAALRTKVEVEIESREARTRERREKKQAREARKLLRG